MRRILSLVLLAGCAHQRPEVPVTALDRPTIVQTGAPVLRGRAADVSPQQLGTPEFQALVSHLVETMRRAPGVGLAAPQVGMPLRVFVIEDRPEYVAKLEPVERQERERTPVAVRVFVNPVLRPIGEAKATFFEGCLSVAGFVALVERWAEVEVDALDEHGQAQTWRVRGWPARILQHETEHLEGSLYIDRMMDRSFSTAEQAKLRFGGRPIADIRRELGL